MNGCTGRGCALWVRKDNVLSSWRQVPWGSGTQVREKESSYYFMLCDPLKADPKTESEEQEKHWRKHLCTAGVGTEVRSLTEEERKRPSA
jgi:hypothetical protein